MSILRRTLVELEKIFLRSNVDKGHDIEHSIAVLKHINKAIQVHHEPLSEPQKLILQLASILHDADDSKFFSNRNNENALYVLQNSLPEYYGYSPSHCVSKQYIEEEVVDIIRLVSCRKNLNARCNNLERWKLLVRWCDRLESMGKIGAYRAYQYNVFKNLPLFLDSTPTPQTLEELNEHRIYDRFNNYINNTGGSVSMIDHYYDKNLFLIDMVDECKNKYINEVALSRNNTTIEFLLQFGKTKHIDTEKIVEEVHGDVI